MHINVSELKKSLGLDGIGAVEISDMCLSVKGIKIDRLIFYPHDVVECLDSRQIIDVFKDKAHFD